MRYWLRRAARMAALMLGMDTPPARVQHAHKVRGGSTMSLPHYITIDGEVMHKPGYCGLSNRTYLIGRDAP